MTKQEVKLPYILKGVNKMKKVLSMSIISIGLCLGANASDYTMTDQTPDGSYVGGGSYHLAPDGSYQSGSSSILAPNGKYIGR